MVCLSLLCFFSSKIQAQKNLKIHRVCASAINENIVLNWNLPIDSCGKYVKIEIWGRQDNFSGFIKIDEINDINATQYTHVDATVVSANWNYYLIYKFLCNDDSLHTDTAYIDYNQPPVINIDSVSIDINTGETTIGWSNSSAKDIFGYVLWKNAGNNNNPFDTVANTFYSENNSNTTYTLTALDSCFNQSVIGDLHKAINLSYTLDTCKREITLTWTPYIGWKNIAYYNVFVKKNSLAYVLEKSNNSSTLTYVYTYDNLQDTLSFYIQTKNSILGYTSSSNFLKIITPSYKAPENLYITTSTLNAPIFDEYKIYWLNDTNSDVIYYNLYQATANSSPKLYKTFLFDKSLNLYEYSVPYSDHNFLKDVLFYEVKAFDKCDNVLSTSNRTSNIILKSSVENDKQIIHWNEYNFWDGGVNTYEIFKGYDLGTGFTWNYLTSVSDTQYYDNNEIVSVSNEGICYYIKAKENGPNKYNITETSASNKICIIGELLVYIPNAWVIGENHVPFIIQGQYIDFSKSTITVFDRWGSIIFNKHKIDKALPFVDDRNKEIQEGVYGYFVDLYGLDGTKKTLKGNITIFR